MTRLIPSLAAAAALSVLAVAPAAQAAPGDAGDCPGPFEAYTLPQLIELAEQVGRTEAEAESTFGYYNKNGDALVCVQDLSSEKAPDKFNFIDNNAR
jgi:hypothetical protein